MSKKILLLAGSCLAAVAAWAATSEVSVSFGLDTMTSAQVFALDTRAQSGAFSIETVRNQDGSRTITALGDILPIAYWGASAPVTITYTDSDGVQTVSDPYGADGTAVWTPTSAGRWTLTHSAATFGSGASTAIFIVSSKLFAYSEGDGTPADPYEVDDGDAVEQIIADILDEDSAAHPETYPVYVTIGEEGGEDAIIDLDDGDGDDDTSVQVEVAGGTTLQLDANGKITVPAGTVVSIVTTAGGVPVAVEVPGLAVINPDGTWTSAGSELAFNLDTMGEVQIFALDTCSQSPKFYVETCAVSENGTNNLRRVTGTSDVLPISLWGEGQVLAEYQDNTIFLVKEFTEDGTAVWTIPDGWRTTVGVWTLTHTAATFDTAAGAQAVFIIEGVGSDTLESLTLTGFTNAEGGGFAMTFRPAFKEGESIDGAAWFENAKTSGLIKVLASADLSKLNEAEATILNLSDLQYGAQWDAETGTATFNLTTEIMTTVDPSASIMFFKIVVQ